MPDYSEWLTEERLEQTEKEWAAMDRTGLLELINSFEPKTVVEFCCGTGWIPKGLSEDVEYRGFDSNEGCIALARKKNSTRNFAPYDVRTVEMKHRSDLALAFSCLKHFSLAEWDEIYGKVLRAGRRTITSIFIDHEKDREDESRGFPHTAVWKERVFRVAKENGHRVVKIITLPPLVTSKEPLVITEEV